KIEKKQRKEIEKSKKIYINIFWVSFVFRSFDNVFTIFFLSHRIEDQGDSCKFDTVQCEVFIRVADE
ncbi:hypothetical protein, partial [uncultured Dubosiella sp.]